MSEQIVTFQVKEIKKNIAIGAIFSHLGKYKPQRDNYFVATGEVEFGGGYQQTGYFNDSGFRYAEKLYSWQSYLIGKYKKYEVIIPDDIKIVPGQFISVKIPDMDSYSTPLIFYKDRAYGASKKVVKKFKEIID